MSFHLRRQQAIHVSTKSQEIVIEKKNCNYTCYKDKKYEHFRSSLRVGKQCLLCVNLHLKLMTVAGIDLLAVYLKVPNRA